MVNVTPLVLIFVLVIVAMSAGWATPTESAALGALATVIVCLLYRSLSFAAVGEIPGASHRVQNVGPGRIDDGFGMVGGETFDHAETKTHGVAFGRGLGASARQG